MSPWILVVVLIIAIFGVGIFFQRRGRDQHKTIYNASQVALGACLGVFLALSANSCYDAKRTQANLIRVAVAAVGEARRSLEILGEPPAKSQEWDLPEGRRFQLVLRNPIGSLNTLVELASFIERGTPSIVADLLGLNTRLRWVPLHESPGNTRYLPPAPTPELSPHPPTVVSDVRRAVDLLERQLDAWD